MKGERTGTIWLFMWFLDKMTVINYETGEGMVLGGKPIKFEEIRKDLGISRITYTRWINTLRKEGYIFTIRTPYGLKITVFKAFKVFGQSVNKGKRCINTDTSNVSPLIHLYTRSDTSNIRQYSRQDNKTRVSHSAKRVKNKNMWKEEIQEYNEDGSVVKRVKEKKASENLELLLVKYKQGYIKYIGDKPELYNKPMIIKRFKEIEKLGYSVKDLIELLPAFFDEEFYRKMNWALRSFLSEGTLTKLKNDK